MANAKTYKTYMKNKMSYYKQKRISYAANHMCKRVNCVNLGRTSMFKKFPKK